MTFHYVWLLWSSAFLLAWGALWVAVPRYRGMMWRAGLVTAPFGFTEPLFVPAYWNPPSLFDLAQRTRFDIESLIFSFAIGGVGVVLYNVVTRRAWIDCARSQSLARHRWHAMALSSPVLVFAVLYPLPWNPIYPAIAAMALGAIAAAMCRPDLARKTVLGGGLFAAYYAAFMLGLLWSAPGYIERVWNLAALSGVRVVGIPLEELLFGFAFGMLWSSAYEHIAWRYTLRYSPDSMAASRLW